MFSSTTATISLPDGTKIFYRTAGPSDGSVILLLHGFPSSSHQFRNLIPILAAAGYRIIAPDLPGYGFTEPNTGYTYNFENFSKTIGSFVDSLRISRFALYIFDYGAPTGLRLALERPNAVTAIITQNGNAYNEGFGAEFWAPVKKYWSSNDPSDRQQLSDAFLKLEATKWQYTNGTPADISIAPESYTLDQALMERPGNKDIQLDVLKDYATNVPLYPKFQEYFRQRKVPILAVWGKNDVIFVPPGAEAFKRDSPDAEVHMLDGGHFLVESHTEEVGKLMVDFLKKKGI